jgi:flagellar assembly factor FliW
MSSINTTSFGEINVDPDKIITFPQGIPGFHDCTRFTLIHEDGSEGIVHFLQSIDQGDLAFSVGEPSQFGIHYQFTLSDEETALLELERPEDALVLLLLYKDDDAAAQVRAGTPPVRGAIDSPLVINVKSHKGLQKVLQNMQPSVLLSDISSSVEPAGS